jgi:hypothetical protein
MTVANSNLQTVADQDGAVILDIERGLITTLNATGGFVWQRLQRSEPLEVIIVNLMRETGAELLEVERDVRAFVEDLKQKHLLPH